jgi:hypothetical protein
MLAEAPAVAAARCVIRSGHRFARRHFRKRGSAQ